jgi:hypothetical protein
MRRLANENPVVQIALIGTLFLVCAFMLYTRVMSSGESESAPAGEAATSGPAATAPSPGADATVTPDGAPAPDSAAPETAPEAGSAAPPEAAPEAVPTGALVPGPGLPESVVKAYADGKAVVLLVLRQRGLDDQPVEAAVRALEGRPDLAVFVTGAKSIARYSRITQGVNVSRVPALVVIQPRRVSGDVPRASVSYGFRGAESVVQAVRDALYEGGNVPYYPE